MGAGNGGGYLYSPSTLEAEAGVQGQYGMHETIPKPNQTNNKSLPDGMVIAEPNVPYKGSSLGNVSQIKQKL